MSNVRIKETVVGLLKGTILPNIGPIQRDAAAAMDAALGSLRG